MGLKLKAQSAMEFLALTGVLLIVFIFFYMIVFERINLINDQKDVTVGQDIAQKVQREILLAARVSDGYRREFFLPDRVEGFTYSITISGRELSVQTPKTEVVKPIPIVVGNIAKGTNIIQKTDGIIYIN
jgi:hypothetical protein